MQLLVHGMFLLTGETRPLRASTRANIASQVHRTLRRSKVLVISASVTMAEMIGPRGRVQKHCRICLHLVRGGTAVCEELGWSTREAVFKCLRQVSTALTNNTRAESETSNIAVSGANARRAHQIRGAIPEMVVR